MIAKFLTNTAWMLLMILITGLIFIRVAPHDVKTLHVPPPIKDKPEVPMMYVNYAQVERQMAGPPAEVLAAVNEVVLLTSRTRLLAGSIEEGMITYVTRSLILGFPDYTTIHVEPSGQGSRVTINARQRFGVLDFGVNSARVHGWLSALKALK